MTAAAVAFTVAFAAGLPAGIALAAHRLRHTLPAIWHRHPAVDAGEVVYFVQLGDTGPIKIGTTRHLEHRLRSLQTAAPARLHVLRVVGGGHDLEADLHASFARYRGHGEWFEPSPELLHFITTLP